MSDSVIRLLCFISILTVMAIWEAKQPFSTVERKTKRLNRWSNHLGLVFIGTFLSRLLLPVGLAGVALWSENAGIGILNSLPAPVWFQFLCGLLLLDMAIYWQHRLFHRIPMLWALHRVHHVDPDVDVSTAFRFHPIELVLSLFIKALVIVALGVPAQAIILFEIALSSFALFNHSNVTIPPWLERPLSRVVITPRLHRFHHSIVADESQRNFGFSLVIWDKLFGSFIDRTSQTSASYHMGVAGFDGNVEKLNELLGQPFSVAPSKAQKSDEAKSSNKV